MKALVIVPTRPSSARLIECGEPSLAEGNLLCEMLAIGVCGTDRELMAGVYGAAPEGESDLVIGHESVGRVLESDDDRFQTGDLVVGIVRRPDPVPCASCAAGEWDMCENGLYTERGIFKRNGYASERFRLESNFAVKVDPQLGELAVLLEPCSVVAKAWEQCERIFARASFRTKKVLITGAGPVGLLAAMIGVQRGYETHVLDREVSGPKPKLVSDLGAIYHHDASSVIGSGKSFALTIECTGAVPLVVELMSNIAPDGILCLTGVSTGGRTIGIDIGAFNRKVVLTNEVIFGSVNANRRHFEIGANALASADKSWLSRIITRRVPLSKWFTAYDRLPNDVKTILIRG